MSLIETLESAHADNKSADAKRWFQKLIQENQYVGDLYSINYESARVIIHDSERKNVGGIPSLSFLIASRVDPSSDTIDYKAEDTSFLLVRVMDSAPLPQDKEAERIRVETAQRVSGETDKHWDSDGVMDAKTRVALGFAGVECRIIGTFFLESDPANEDAPLVLRFGSDISNYYPNRGLKVYKPNSTALEAIVNYCDPAVIKEHFERYGSTEKVELGHVRYASTNRQYQQVNDVPVYIYPADLLSQKSALFGMTRTGKSNTTKIIAKSVFELRDPNEASDAKLRIGQIIFDPNGEYANENVQDKGALKNVWKIINGGSRENDVDTFGLTAHSQDPERKLMLINFYLEDNLQSGKDILNSMLSDDATTHIKNFIQVAFEKPDESDRSALTRYNRRVLAYRSVLARAGFSYPPSMRPVTRGLFNADLLRAMKTSNSTAVAEYQSAASIFESTSPTWHQMANAFEILDRFIRDTTSGYSAFEIAYVSRAGGSGDNWADDNFKKIIGIYQYPNATRKLGKVTVQHSHITTEDYADDIYKQLVQGKLVIIDQSSGEPELNKSSAERIMWRIFRGNQSEFREGRRPPNIIVYIEEAHNLLPSGSDLDLLDVWVRTAKEGSKYGIGMVYATQEVSSIQKNILKNTSNWFISHLNNTDETKELCKYYDFADFEPSIRRAQDKGFLRVKTLSNLFVVPVQVDKFEVELTDGI